MKDLRKAAEMALEGFEQIYRSCGFVEEEQKKLHKHAKELSTCVKQDCKNYMEQLRQALAQEESELTRPRSEKPWVKTYCGGKPNYCTPEQEPLGGEWVPCVKLPIIVHVRNQRDGETHISTREGITPALPEDLIMRGVAGEEYPIGRELFERTYTFDVDAVNMTQERVDETAKHQHVSDMVNHPPHYKSGGIETIDFIEAKELPYHLGNVVKYISRAGIKSHCPIEDLRKAQWYLNRYVQLMEKTN